MNIDDLNKHNQRIDPWQRVSPENTPTRGAGIDIDELVKRLRDPLLLDPGFPTRMQAAAALESIRAEHDGLKEAIEKQARSAIMGMDAAKKHASEMLKEAAKLNAESKPDILASERAANAALTEEVESIRAELEREKAERQTFQHGHRLISARCADLERELEEARKDVEREKILLTQAGNALSIFYGSGWHYSEEEIRQIEKARDDIIEWQAARQQQG